MFKRKNSLGGSAGAPVAAANPVAAAASGKKGRKSIGSLPARTTSMVEFKSVLPPNLVSHEFARSSRKLPRYDYWLVLLSIVLGAVGLVRTGLEGKALWAKKQEAEKASRQAAVKAEERGKLDKDGTALAKKYYECQRLFLPAQARFSLSEFLFNAAKHLPKEFFMAELSGRFEPEFYFSGKRVNGKAMDKVDGYVGGYSLSIKVQGLGKGGTSEKIDPFLKSFDPPAAIGNTSGGMQEGTAFQLDYAFTPLVQFYIPGQGGLAAPMTEPPVPPRLSLSSFKR